MIAGEFAAQKSYAKPVIIATQPKLAFARAAKLIYPARNHQSGTHPTAVVHPSVRPGANVIIEARVVIGEDVLIGQGTKIGAGSVMVRALALDAIVVFIRM